MEQHNPPTPPVQITDGVISFSYTIMEHNAASRFGGAIFSAGGSVLLAQQSLMRKNQGALIRKKAKVLSLLSDQRNASHPTLSRITVES
jgi:hypothetical protein